MTRSQMVTHDSRRNEHCAVERKANTLSKLLENSLKTNYYHCFCCKHSLHGNGRRQRLLFTRVYISLKSNLADSARCLAVSNLRERQRVQKESFLTSSGTTWAPCKKTIDDCDWIQENFFRYLIDT